MKNKRLLFLAAGLGALLLYLGYGAIQSWFSQAFPAKPPLRSRDNIENLLIAVAPLDTSKLLSREGTKIQEKIAEHMERDLGLRALRLSKPVSMGAKGPLELKTGFENAEKILADTHADLLIWGNQDERGDGKNWNVYVSASSRAKCLAREEGFSINETSDLDQVADADILEVLDWVTASWRGLIARSEGMYIAKDLKPMVDKIDTVLGLVAEKRMGLGAQLEVKRNLALFLSDYGQQMKDVTALQNSIRLAKEVLGKSRVDPETKIPIGDRETESVLARCLFTLGCQQMDNDNLKEAVKAYETALKGVSRKYDSADWAVLQTGLGSSLAELGKRQSDMEKIKRAAQAFEGAFQETSELGQPHQWVCVQTGLGACYLYQGAQETTTDNLKKAIPHFLSSLGKDAAVLAPDDAANSETNIGVAYFTLGERERSAEDMRQSILHSNRAVDLFQRMGNDYGVGFSVSNLGMAQMRLAFYIQDDQLLVQSRASLEKSQALIPKTQDLDMWAQNELYLGTGRELMGVKSYDRKTLQEASDIFKNLRNNYDRRKRRPMWNQLCNFQSEVEILLGNLDCESKREDDVIRMLGDIRSFPGSSKDDLRAEQVAETLGKAMNHKGNKEKNPETIRQAISLLEEALAIASKGNMETLKCSCRGEILLAFSNLLSLAPDTVLASRAKTYLEDFQKDCSSVPLAVDEAGRHYNAAKLERALASFEKDKGWLAKARPLVESAHQVFQTNHYVFFAAAAELELANEDFLLGELSGNQEAYGKALKEFSDSEKTFRNFGVCWEKDLKDKISKCKKLAGLPPD